MYKGGGNTIAKKKKNARKKRLFSKLTCSCAKRSLCSSIVLRSDKICTSSASALKASATVWVRCKYAIPDGSSCVNLATTRQGKGRRRKIGKKGEKSRAVMEGVLTGKSGARAGRFRVCEKCEVRVKIRQRRPARQVSCTLLP
jgi:hypothetical protein